MRSYHFVAEVTFNAVLAIFCSFHYGENDSEAVGKIARDEKASERLSQMLIARYSLHSHSISITAGKGVYCEGETVEDILKFVH